MGAGLEPSELRVAIHVHLHQMEQEAATHPFLDLALARGIAARLERVLLMWPRLRVEEQERVVETVLYVVENDDEEHDIHSPIGLVDDEEQVTALETYLASRGHGQER